MKKKQAKKQKSPIKSFRDLKPKHDRQLNSEEDFRDSLSDTQRAEYDYNPGDFG